GLARGGRRSDARAATAAGHRCVLRQRLRSVHLRPARSRDGRVPPGPACLEGPPSRSLLNVEVLTILRTPPAGPPRAALFFFGRPLAGCFRFVTFSGTSPDSEPVPTGRHQGQ